MIKTWHVEHLPGNRTGKRAFYTLLKVYPWKSFHDLILLKKCQGGSNLHFFASSWSVKTFKEWKIMITTLASQVPHTDTTQTSNLFTEAEKRRGREPTAVLYQYADLVHKGCLQGANFTHCEVLLLCYSDIKEP